MSESDGERWRELGILGELVGYRLKRAHVSFLKDFHRALEGVEIRPVLFSILAIILHEPGVKQGEIGRRLGITRGNMVSLVNELSEMGLVERRAAESDRRALALHITAEGKAVLTASHKRILKYEQRMLSDLSPEERSILVDLLARLSF